LLISLSFSITSCKFFNSQPRSPLYDEYRFIRTNDPAHSYFYYTDGDQDERRVYIKDIPVEPSKPEDIFVATDLIGRNEITRYEREMTKWIPKHCKN